MRLNFSNSGPWLAAMALLFAPLAVQASAPSAKTANPSHEAAGLLRAVRSDAVQVHTAAVQLDKLTRNTGATWVEYDRQWNEIKPAEEDLRIKLVRLEKIRTTIPLAEQKQVDQAKTEIQRIAGRTRALRVLLDQPGIQTSNAKFPACAVSLRNESGQLEKVARAI